MKKATPQYQQSSPSRDQSITASASPDELLAKAPTKIARILTYLLEPGNSLNRFEAEKHGDHCLHTTISTLANSHGLEIQRQTEEVPTNWGEPCNVTRYSLPESQYQQARAVLAQMGKRSKGRKKEVA
ncbi:hypothetical protein HA520_05230 [Azotobacter chroococcum]|uniref:Helix-turn-helix domain-containing protein n=1 Tax=Azotobacter chroococcum TaxID=353 RepID=A0AA43Z4N3_9GAMM|nr:hypothetical protein [Azotobacter chroococcum]NHN76691.1 hypothetical protein [Azotobacter chroococcum]